MRKNFYKLLLLFEIIFLIKLVFAILPFGPVIFSDEPCVIQIAKHFIHNLELSSCEELTGFPAGTPHPLYSILISPIFLFFKGPAAFTAALILNSFLISALVFPLYGIITRFLKSDKGVYLGIFVLLFLPQIVAFEKLVMTELLFIVVNIWFLYFYLKSFSGSNARANKLAAFFFALASLLTRPFGFITMFSMILNEWVLSKRKWLYFVICFLVGLFIAGTVFFFQSDIYIGILQKFEALKTLQGWEFLLIAFKNQVNSFTVTTFILPLSLLFYYFFADKSSEWRRIKWFLLSLIGMNFLISMQHLYGYLVVGNVQLGLLTRYINLSLILIYLFSLIFLIRDRKVRFDVKTWMLTLFLVVLLFFFDSYSLKQSLNVDLSLFYNVAGKQSANVFVLNEAILGALFFVFAAWLFLFLHKGLKKVLFIVSGTLILSLAFATMVILGNYSQNNYLSNFLLDKKVNVTFLAYQEVGEFAFNMWQLIGLTENNIELAFIVTGPPPDTKDYKLDREKLTGSKYIEEADYVVTKYQMDLPLIFELNGTIKVYENVEETEDSSEAENNIKL